MDVPQPRAEGPEGIDAFLIIVEEQGNDQAANAKKSTAARRDVARAGLRSLDQEIKIAELRVAVRRMVNLCESPGCWRRADKDLSLIHI